MAVLFIYYASIEWGISTMLFRYFRWGMAIGATSILSTWHCGGKNPLIELVSKLIVMTVSHPTADNN